MLKRPSYTFVLLPQQFDEISTVILTTLLREAGQLVKLVSLTVHEVRGAHGLTLKSDITLDQMLRFTAQTSCLIIPYTTVGIYPLLNDPRSIHLIQELQALSCLIITGPFQTNQLKQLGLDPDKQKLVWVYPNFIHISPFVTQILNWLKADKDS